MDDLRLIGYFEWRQLKCWHLYQCLFSFLHLCLQVVLQILQVFLLILSFIESHDEQLVLSLACLDLLFHELLLVQHIAYLVLEHVNVVEVLLLHLLKSSVFILEPL